MGSITISAAYAALIAVCTGIAAIAAAVKVIKPLMVKPFQQINEKLDTIKLQSDKSDREIKNKLQLIDDQVGTVQHEKMMWAYVYYGIEKHTIRLETKISLFQMYDQYTECGKHNHVPKDFKSVIDNAPIAV